MGSTSGYVTHAGEREMGAAGDDIAVTGLVTGEAKEKAVVLAELVDGGVSGVVFPPQNLRGSARRLAIELDDLHQVAVGQIHDAVPDDERCYRRAAAEFGTQTSESPQLAAIAHAQGL